MAINNSMAALLRPLYITLFQTPGFSPMQLLSPLIMLSTLAVCIVRLLHPRAQTMSISKPLIVPPVVRSWFPWVGQGIQFLKSPYVFLRSCRSRYGTTFKFQLFGRYVIALSSPTAVSNFLRDRSGAFDVIDHQQTHRFCGVKGDEEHYAFLYSTLKTKVAPIALRSLSRRSLGNITPSLISRLLEDIPKFGDDQPKSLHQLVHRTVYETITHTFFGPLLPAGTCPDFREYDEGVAWIVKSLPALVPRSVQARDRLVATYSRYFKSAWRGDTGGFLEGASDMVSKMYRELKATELSHDETTRLMVHVLWAANSNIMRVTTWTMHHILTDKDVYNQVCDEIRSFVDVHFPGLEGLENLDFKFLDNDGLPLLSSVIQEVLRTKSSNVSIREATRDTVIMDANNEAILVRKGEYVMADMISMHRAEDLQQNPEQFQADRYLEKPSYKSVVFGAGEHMCAGRHFANFLIRMFIVVTLSLYDITVDNIPSTSKSTSDLPVINTSSLSVLSFISPQADLTLHLSLRKSR